LVNDGYYLSKSEKYYNGYLSCLYDIDKKYL
jgi:hypothetical protein